MYFRLYDQSHQLPILQQVKQQEVDSSRNSLTETPVFGDQKRNLHKIKIRTQATQDQFETYNKSFNLNIQHTKKLLKQKKNTQSVQKLNTSLVKKLSCSKKPQKKRTQKLKTVSLQQIDLSTMSGFYKQKNMNENNHIEKRHKMLQKIQADKQRSVDLKQQDIFYITKYASKFNIDTKKLLQ